MAATKASADAAGAAGAGCIGGRERARARRYWAEHPVRECQTLAIVGQGPLAEALLDQALLVNLFSVEGGVRYLAMGDWAAYRRARPQLDQVLALNCDALAFLDGPWQARLDALGGCDRVIVCEPAEGADAASKLRAAGLRAEVHVVDARPSDGAQLPDERGGMICAIAYRLGTAACDGCARQAGAVRGAEGAGSVVRGRLERLAAFDLSICLDCPAFRAEWDALDDFTRASNCAVADHDACKLWLLSQRGVTRAGGFAALPLPVRDELQEIEHIRWCRFHFLNGWRYAPGPKDRTLRTHPCLVPYARLTREVKDYDGDAYATVHLRTRP